jgi:hypothetical protein
LVLSRSTQAAVAEHGVTVLHFVPSMLDLFLDDHGSRDLPNPTTPVVARRLTAT